MKNTMFSQKRASAAVVAMIGALTAQAADISYTTNITSGLFNGGSAFTVGNTTNGITVTISGSGAITNGSASIGPGAANSNNTMVVTGSGVWSNTSTLVIGNSGAGSGLIISNGGTVYAVSGTGNSTTIGGTASGSNNWILLTGNGSLWTNSAATFSLGSASGGNTLTISNNAKFYAAAQMWVGNSRLDNKLNIVDGGKFYVASTFNTGGGSSSNSTTLVSGAGAVITITGSSVAANVGNTGAFNSMIVSNGGWVVHTNSGSILTLGNGSGGFGNSIMVTDPGSMLQVNGTLRMGVNASSALTNNYLTISNGGLVEANTISLYGTNSNNFVTNSTGILQFTTNAPAITLAPGNAIVMTNATLSYRNLAAGTVVNLTNNWGSTGVGAFTWKGANTFRLDGSTATNTLANAYTFYNNNGPTNYNGLELLNNAMIKGKGLMIGDGTASHGGLLLISNATATFVGVLTNNSANINLAASTITASNSIVWLGGSAATTTAGQVTMDVYTTNTLGGAVTFAQLAGATQMVNGAIQGTGTLTKNGAGTLTLAAANTYGGGTLINSGTLKLTSSGTLGTGAIDIKSTATFDVSGTTSGTYTLGSGASMSLTNRGTFAGGLIIQSGATVSGGGIFNGAVTNFSGGTLTPGIGGDTNFFTSLTLAGGSTNSFWVGNTAHDMSVVSNSLDYTGSGMPQLKLDLNGYTWARGDTFVLYNNLFTGMSTLNGTNTYFQFQDAFGNTTNLLNNALFSAITGGGSATNLFSVRYDFDNGGGQSNDIMLTAIPEPASINLLVMLGAAYWMRRCLHGQRRRWDV